MVLSGFKLYEGEVEKFITLTVLALFLEEYVDLGSNERILEYDESYCGAYCLYMIYLIDRRFIIEGALGILVYQVKCTKMYDKCICFSCKVRGKAEVNVNDNSKDIFNDNVRGNVNVNDNQETCSADGNENFNVNGNGNDNVNVNNNLNGNVNAKDNVNVNVNENVSGYGNDYGNGNGSGETWPETHCDNVDDKYISIISETEQRDKPCSLCRCGGASSVENISKGYSLSAKTSGLVSPIKGDLIYVLMLMVVYNHNHGWLILI